MLHICLTRKGEPNKFLPTIARTTGMYIQRRSTLGDGSRTDQAMVIYLGPLYRLLESNQWVQ